MKRGGMLAALFALSVTAAVIPARGQNVFPPEHRMRKIAFAGMPEMFLKGLADTYSVTIGFENAPGHDRYVSLEDLSDANLYDALDALVRAAPWLRWREEGGAIDVFPAEGSAQFLNVATAYPGVSDVSQREAIDLLVRLPAVRAALTTRGLTIVNFERKEEPGAKVSLPAGTQTVRRVLHEIVKGSGTKLWVLRWSERGKSFSLGTPAPFRRP
jgi:hypothetical protein